MSNLLARYKSSVRESLMERYKYHSCMQVPRVDKVVLNMRVKEAVQDRKHLADAEKILTAIAGQKAVKTVARKSVAVFSIRQGFPLGCRVTLRRKRMWAFLDRLVQVALPRIRDFRGLYAGSFDGFGNYNFGIDECLIFPEIDVESIEKVRGFDVCIVTSTRKNEEAQALLQGLGFPFKKSAAQ